MWTSNVCPPISAAMDFESNFISYLCGQHVASYIYIIKVLLLLEITIGVLKQYSELIAITSTYSGSEINTKFNYLICFP